MEILRTRLDLHAFLASHKTGDQSLGFVPTMGALHAGHFSLIQASLSTHDLTLVSIFVNPSQFGPTEDYDRYPRQDDADSDRLRELGVSVLFLPDVDEMYPLGLDKAVQVSVPEVSRLYCGVSRPGFFDGVCQIVLRFLTLVQPDALYMGEKDFQQLSICRMMITDLGLPIQVVSCPIVRDESGVALSSRLQYLTSDQMVCARSIYPALLAAKTCFDSGERSPSTLHSIICDGLSIALCVEYIAFVSSETLAVVDEISSGDRVLLACVLTDPSTTSSIRLIDNLRF